MRHLKAEQNLDLGIDCITLIMCIVNNQGRTEWYVMTFRWYLNVRVKLYVKKILDWNICFVFLLSSLILFSTLSDLEIGNWWLCMWPLLMKSQGQGRRVQPIFYIMSFIHTCIFNPTIAFEKVIDNIYLEGRV